MSWASEKAGHTGLDSEIQSFIKKIMWRRHHLINDWTNDNFIWQSGEDTKNILTHWFIHKIYFDNINNNNMYYYAYLTDFSIQLKSFATVYSSEFMISVIPILIPWRAFGSGSTSLSLYLHLWSTSRFRRVIGFFP